MKTFDFIEEYIIFEIEYIVLSINKGTDNNYFIFSFIMEDYDLGELHYFGIWAEEQQYLDFLEGKIAYLEVFKNAKDIFRIRKNYDYQIIDTQKITINQVAKDEFPLASSFFPRTDLVDLIEDLKKCICLKQNSRYSALKVAKKLPSIDTNSYPKKSYPKQNQLKPKENYVPKTSTTSAGK